MFQDDFIELSIHIPIQSAAKMAAIPTASASFQLCCLACVLKSLDAVILGAFWSTESQVWSTEKGKAAPMTSLREAISFAVEVEERSPDNFIVEAYEELLQGRE